MTTSYTAIGREGYADAEMHLVAEFIQRCLAGKEHRAYVATCDRLQPDRITDDACTAIAALPDFEQNAPQLEELERRNRELTDFEAGAATRQTRELADAIAHVLDERCATLRADLRQLFDLNPGVMVDALRRCRQTFQGFPAPQRTQRSLIKLRNLLAKARELPEFESELLPATAEKIASSLIQLARQRYENALRQIVEGHAWDAWQTRLTALEPFFKELETRAVRLQQRLDTIRTIFEDNQRLVRQQHHDLTTTLAVVLAGPTEEQVLAGMRARASCGDLQELYDRFTTAFESRLRDYAAQHCPHLESGTGMSALLLDIEPLPVAEVFDALFEERLGSGHSPYQLVEAFGIETCVEVLWNKADRTSFFTAHGDEMFGLEPDEKAILRLPASARPEDEPIRAHIIREFESCYGEIHVEEAHPGDAEISLTRIVAGLVIGIEPGNQAALHRLCQAAADGHAPFLKGFVPTSPDGHVGPEHPALYHHSNLDETTDALDSTDDQDR